MDTKQYKTQTFRQYQSVQTQYISTSIIIYGPCIANMFVLEYPTHTFCRKLINVINSKSTTKLDQDIPMHK